MVGRHLQRLLYHDPMELEKQHFVPFYPKGSDGRMSRLDKNFVISKEFKLEIKDFGSVPDELLRGVDLIIEQKMADARAHGFSDFSILMILPKTNVNQTQNPNYFYHVKQNVGVQIAYR